MIVRDSIRERFLPEIDRLLAEFNEAFPDNDAKSIEIQEQLFGIESEMELLETRALMPDLPSGTAIRVTQIDPLWDFPSCGCPLPGSEGTVIELETESPPEGQQMVRFLSGTRTNRAILTETWQLPIPKDCMITIEGS